MANTGPVPIPFPLSSFPGANSQESAGRLINCYAEPLGEGGPAKFKWIRSAGLSQHAATANSGYRGGLAVNNAAIECWANNASSIDVNGNVTSIGNFPGTGKVSIARNQASPVPDVVAVDIGNGAYVLESATVAPATVALTFSGSTLNIGDVITVAILNASLSPPFPVSILHTVVASESPTTLATAFKTAINANSTLSAANISATSSGAVLTINHQGAVGNQTSILAAITPIGSAAAPTTISASVTGAGNETVAFTPTGGVLASSGGSLTATSIAAINGTTFTAGDAVSLTFTNANVSTFPITISHTLGAAETATTIATALKTAINASTALAAVGITSTAAGGVVTTWRTQTWGSWHFARPPSPAHGDLCAPPRSTPAPRGRWGAARGSAPTQPMARQLLGRSRSRTQTCPLAGRVQPRLPRRQHRLQRRRLPWGRAASDSPRVWGLRVW